MTELAVITPTYRPDAEFFDLLHASVLEFTPEDTVHHVFVSEGDLELFSKYEGPRCRVRTSSSMLPRRYRQVPGMNYHVNVRRPWPPVRGWIMQQTIKLAAAGDLDADLVLMADSDVVFVRPTTADRFQVAGRRWLYREDGGVTADMERHVIWHRVARELFGLPPAPPPPLPDYVSPLNAWEPEVVRAMQRHIEKVTGRNWLDVFNGQLHISEFILYGVFVDEVLHQGKELLPSDITICHNNWQRSPLSVDEAVKFAGEIGPDAVAMMISAKSDTPMDPRRAAIARVAEIVGTAQ